jgi:homoserine O-succinyltransferase
MAGIRPLRIGILNLMPKAQDYDAMLQHSLHSASSVTGLAAPRLSLVRMRLESHTYASSDRKDLEARYRTFDAACAEGQLDGMILTGAPVEEIPFESVRYWPELCEILRYAAKDIPSTLGLCWGAMALAAQLGIEKRVRSRKLFGVHALTLRADTDFQGHAGDVVYCAQSRHADLDPTSVEAAERLSLVRILAEGHGFGVSVIESRSGRFRMHLGHPEYDARRLVAEYPWSGFLCLLAFTAREQARHLRPVASLDVFLTRLVALRRPSFNHAHNGSLQDRASERLQSVSRAPAG